MKSWSLVSYRGMLAVAIGVAFLWFAFDPGAFGEETLPALVAGILILAGAGMVVMGVVSCRFVYSRFRLLRDVAPTPAEVVIRVNDSSDSTTYTLEVRLADGAWLLGPWEAGASTGTPKTPPSRHKSGAIRKRVSRSPWP